MSEEESDLEMRIVAAALGEASASERAELERLISANPELREFQRRIGEAHGLLAEAAKGGAAPLRLSEDRRRKLLEVLGKAEAAVGPAAPVAMEPPGRRWVLWAAGIAAAAAAILALLPAIHLPVYSQIQTGSAEDLPHASFKAPVGKSSLTVADEKKQPDLLSADLDNLTIARTAGLPAKNAANKALDGIRTEMAQNQDAARKSGEDVDSEKDAQLYAYDANRRRTVGQLDNERNAPLHGTTGPPITLNAPVSKAMPAKEVDNSDQEQKIATLSGGTAGSGMVQAASSLAAAYGVPQAASAAVDSAAPASPTLAPTLAPALPAAAPAMVAAQQAPVERAYENSRAPVFLSRQAASALADVPDASLEERHLETGSRDAQTNAVGGLSLGEANAYAGATYISSGTLHLQARTDAPAAPPPDQGELKASEEPFSTFSLHVGDASFRLAEAALAAGQAPDPGTIRPEEFYNAFDYGDPGPAAGEKIACHVEQCAHPFLQQRNLVRIAMKVAAAGRAQPLRLTVLVDTSGSMEREDRAASVRRAMKVLASLLGQADRVTLIGFARQPRLLAEEMPGADAGKLAELVARTPREGGTNVEEGLRLAGELALRHYAPQAQNRIVLLTDGAANLGDADPARLGAAVARLRQQGIAFDACGVGAEGYNDEILEALTRKGDGRYYYLNSPEDADAGFASRLAGTLHPAAQNVKMQVRFNPARVASYRLIGFEKHRLNTEDFRNDKVAAAELASEEAAVAVYQAEVLPSGEGELGDVFVRFRDPADGAVVERSWTVSYEPQARPFDEASPSMQLAGTAALLAEKLRGGAAVAQIDLDALAPVLARLRSVFGSQPRVQELVRMFEETRRMEGKH